MKFKKYFENLNKHYLTGNAREHAYRGDLATLLMDIVTDIVVTNEASSDSRINKPDYTITRKNIPIGYIEAKDITDNDITGEKLNRDQFNRYKQAYPNIFFTNYLDFTFYQNGELKASVKIGRLDNGRIEFIEENFEIFESHYKDFATTISQNIKSPTKLASMMAGKAKQMALEIERALNEDDKSEQFSPLKKQMLDFQKMLIHDIDNKAFADIYAQTIAYGMFAARYHDPTLPTFSRLEAAELIPKSNPFLRKLFQDIAGFDLDKRLIWFVEDLVSIFLASDVAQIMKNFGKSTKQEDPVVHFYETFLGEYNPALRKARGVWYTPQPVVNFIVRAVDDILKTEFNLSQGLADTSKTKVKVDYYGKTIEKEVHKVQILDPATGTGTFLAEVVKHIYKKFEGQKGIWSKYVANDLIPRLNGFELLMASYAMAHLKMDMLLTETGYKPSDDQRFKIFLTNSLEEAHQDSGTLFSSWLSDESNQANEIKRDTPVMAIIGNPPYSGVSSNNGKWITSLIDTYKKEPNGSKLQEQNSKYLNDDYVKFIRFSQHVIDKNGEGILAFISNNGYIDNPTFRGMRASLAKSFTDIYIVDLHGNSKKQEKNSDGSVDQNVFDIMVGVAIIVAVKKKEFKGEAKIHHFDLLGKREEKYQFLVENNLESIPFLKFEPTLPFYNFYKVNNTMQSEYYGLISLENLFSLNSVGVKTSRDTLLISKSKNELENNLKFFFENDSSDIEKKFSLKFNNNWEHSSIIEKLAIDKARNEIQKIRYRPFDDMFICYNDTLVDRTRKKVMHNLDNKKNTALIVGRQGQAVAGDDWNIVFISDCLSDMNIFARGGGMAFPLYLYPESESQANINFEHREPNLNQIQVDKIAKSLGLTFTNEKEETPNTFAPIDLLDYIYAVLHSPTYREKYKEFLKIDFPRVPAPLDHETFWKLLKLGGELRQIHLLESPIVEKYITGYPEDGDNVVKKPTYKNGHVYINDTQYFSNVPVVAWNFYIGGYQPAQKWLKDRKDRELSYEDILHYQKIIVALSETDRIMKEIDLIEI
jgi:predicted helicase